MSKNKIAVIAAKTDGLILYNYCNNANVSRTGKILLNNYNNLDDVLELIKRGNIKTINKKNNIFSYYGNYTQTEKSIQTIIEENYEANLFFYFDKEWKFYDRKYKDVIDSVYLLQSANLLQVPESELLERDRKYFLKKKEFIKSGILNDIF